MSATGEDKGWHSQSEDIDARVWQQPEDPRPRPSPQNLCPVTPAASRAPAAPTTPKPYHSPWERLQHSGWDERLGLKRGLDSPQKQVLAASANDLSAQVRKSTTSQVKVPFQHVAPRKRPHPIEEGSPTFDRLLKRTKASALPVVTTPTPSNRRKTGPGNRNAVKISKVAVEVDKEEDGAYSRSDWPAASPSLHPDSSSNTGVLGSGAKAMELKAFAGFSTIVQTAKRSSGTSEEAGRSFPQQQPEAHQPGPIQRPYTMEDTSIPRPFNCHYCPTRYTQFRTLLRHHKKLHETDPRPRLEDYPRPFICDVCEDDFPDRPSRDRHTLSVHGMTKAPFVCDVCSKGFLTETNLEYHKIKFHGAVFGVLTYPITP